ncbi:hypothetical protein [Paenibacillus xylaniclasticus]|uniref:hypothetical protein n=1 Tax=Paenibacillus xylaniclasticus TaxID=588083 RepID=UPI000FD8D175|nr:MULTISPECIES: hypothetical protein [Paenibacillus]GFN33022.1 hypothetical protein PCURB6_32820 [Paenibacillus curdlanolyticus]
MDLDFFARLSDKELCAAYEGDMEWMESEFLADDNPLKSLCQRYEAEIGEEIVIMDAIDAILYEMACRYYRIKAK